MAGNRSLGRRRPVREVYPLILIVCEGEKSEPDYFKWLRHHCKSLVHLDCRAGGDPKTLVERAVALKDDAERLAKRSKDPNEHYEQVWCVFDVDEHLRIPEAKEQAGANGISVAISNPCFELWLMLHFQEQTADIDRHSAQRKCRGHLPDYHKALSREQCRELVSRQAGAVERAQNLETWQRQQGREEDSNPSTGVYRLAEEIRSRGGWPST